MEERQQPLHLKYRPQTFEEFQGGEEIVNSVRSKLGTVHVYLFHGSRGCGKTTLARLIARELGADAFDIYELDAATNRGINEVKTLKASVSLCAMGGGCKVYIIDECHQLTGDAKDALLKTLEEPPSHVYFILCTTELGKVTPTIRSRAKAGEYQVEPLSRRDATALLERVMGAEGLEVSPTVFRALLNVGEGIPRELLGLLEKVQGCSEADALKLLEHGRVVTTPVKAVIDALLSGKSWSEVRGLLNAVTEGPEDIRRVLLGYMAKVVMGNDNPTRAYIVLEEFSQPFFSSESENRAMLALSAYRTVARIKGE